MDISIRTFDRKYSMYGYNSSYVFLSNITINKFMDYDPPCKECLVKTMCIEKRFTNNTPSLKINICNDLKKFIREYK